MGQIALAWVGQKVTSPIVGVDSIQSIVTGIVLTPEEVTYLKASCVSHPEVVIVAINIDRYQQWLAKACSWS